MSLIGKLKIGTDVLVTIKNKFQNKKAVVKYVGNLDGKKQELIGVQLDTADGNHSGEFQDKKYFDAKPKHALFAKPNTVKLLNGTPVESLRDN